MMYPNFRTDEALRWAFMAWWSSLEHDRGARAELRRAATPLDVMLCPAFHDARGRLVKAGLDDDSWQMKTRVAAVIGLAAHVREHGSNPPAKAFSIGERPPVSPLRFRRILQADDAAELFRLLRRVLPLAEGIRLSALAQDVLTWGDTTRKRWVYDYAWPRQPAA